MSMCSAPWRPQTSEAWLEIEVETSVDLGSRKELRDSYTCGAEPPSATLDVSGHISAKLVRCTNAGPDGLLLGAPVGCPRGGGELRLRRDGYLELREPLPQLLIVHAA
jgi:hypothetical protein